MTVPARPGQPFTPSQIESGVGPMLLKPLPAGAYSQLAAYLQLLSRWNQKINLTAVRDPGVLVRLHLAECLRAAQRIPADVETVLDYGSGGGLPGIPIQIARPGLRVTLAESQTKKSAFLREVVRELQLNETVVYGGRVEEMPESSIFDLVALRAVDKMAEAVRAAIQRVRPASVGVGGACLVFTSLADVAAVTALGSLPNGKDLPAVDWQPPEILPETDQRVILIGFRN